MKIKWLGHSCFLLTSQSGIRVVTDPFNEKVGYRLPEVEADVVTTSHGHGDHNHTAVIRGSFVHISQPGRYLERGIEISGTAVFHDEDNGEKRGKNTIFKFRIDGINICHCGDLGHLLTSAMVEELGAIDVLLIPVGGVYTVDAAAASEVVRQLKPGISIPMHFKTPPLNFPLDGVDRFLELTGGTRMNRQEIEVNKENVGGFPSVAVLNYE